MLSHTLFDWLITLIVHVAAHCYWRQRLNVDHFQFTGGVDWRSKLDTQPGSVLATELKNNSFKLARWTLSALLAGADVLKVG